MPRSQTICPFAGELSAGRARTRCATRAAAPAPAAGREERVRAGDKALAQRHRLRLRHALRRAGAGAAFGVRPVGIGLG